MHMVGRSFHSWRFECSVAGDDEDDDDTDEDDDDTDEDVGEGEHAQ